MAGEAEIKVKVVPDRQELKAAADDMDSKFDSVSNKFGRSLARGIKRAVISGAVIAGIKSVLNEIDTLNTAIDETLNKFKDIQTKATGQGLSSAEYYKLSELSKVAGVQNFDALYSAFRQQLEAANRGVASPLAQFKGQEANAETFLQVIESLQKQTGQQRNLLSEAIFGAGNVQSVNKLAGADLQMLAKNLFSGISNEQLNRSIAQGDVLAQQQAIASFRREAENLIKRSALITPATIQAQSENERLREERINARIPDYGKAAAVQEVMVKAQTATANGVSKVVDILGNFYKAYKQAKDNQEQFFSGRISREERERRDDQIFKDIF